MLIIEYKPEWVANFELIKKKLSECLAGLCISIEHIGSTSVIGLSAKDIIDIDIIFNDDFESLKKRLESIGYYHNGNQGIEGREVFKREGKIRDSVLDSITHHLYVCRFDCLEYQRHILFRNYLRKSEQARLFYMNQKISLAQSCNEDKKTYAALKQLKLNSFIDYIVELSKEDNYKFERIEC